MPNEADNAAHPASARWRLAGVFVYVVLVLGIDTLAAFAVSWPIDWSVFRWFPFARTGALPFLRQFDAFKFIFWFLVPFVWCLPSMDWGAFGVKRWKRLDYFILAALAAAGVAAMAIIPHVPSLAALYYRPGNATQPFGAKVFLLALLLIWDLSWLPGWEFLHRYVLLRTANSALPRWGWLLVPLSETVYHLQKPGLETLGMLALSIILTLWTIRRKNVLLPFLAHLIIELELAAFMLL